MRKALEGRELESVEQERKQGDELMRKEQAAAAGELDNRLNRLLQQVVSLSLCVSPSLSPLARSRALSLAHSLSVSLAHSLPVSLALSLSRSPSAARSSICLLDSFVEGTRKRLCLGCQGSEAAVGQHKAQQSVPLSLRSSSGYAFALNLFFPD